MFSRPTLVLVDGTFGYERRFGRFSWSTQVNVTNVFNDYERLIRPNSINGYGGISTARFTNQPRAYIWTNTFRF